MAMDKRGLALMLGLIAVFAASFDAFAGGRSADTSNPLSRDIVMNAWSDNGRIQVAVCNLAAGPQTIKAAIGVVDTIERPFGSRTFVLAPNSLQVVQFPVMTQRTPRGNLETSSFAFVYAGSSPATSVEVGAIPIQNMPRDDRTVSLDRYIAAPGDSVTLHYAEKAVDATRLVFAAKEAKLDQLSVAGQPAQDSPAPLTSDALQKLNLRATDTAKYIEEMGASFGFFFPQGQPGCLNLVYKVNEVKGCRVVRIPGARHVVGPSKGKSGGFEITFLAYDPKSIKVEPILDRPPVPETEGMTGVSKS
jgi:hypothetical protein